MREEALGTLSEIAAHQKFQDEPYWLAVHVRQEDGSTIFIGTLTIVGQVVDPPSQARG